MSSSDPLLLAIDQGTQSVRAMLFAVDGTLVAKSQITIEPYVSRQPGWAEQDCGYFWHHLCQACQQLWQQHPTLKKRLVAMALTTQRATVVCLDKHLQPVRPAIIWLDRRRTHQPPKPPAWLRLASQFYGGDTIKQFQRKAECNWLAVDEPQHWQATEHFLLLSGYLTWKLTGNIIDAIPSQVGYLPFDFKKQQWAAPHDIKWKLLQVKQHQLPPLVAAGEPLGQVSATAAKATGIPEGLLCIAAGADKACEVLGSGATTPATACLSYGTTATLNTCNRRYVESMPLVPAYAAAIPEHYNTEVIVQRGYWMVNWFKREFAAAEVAEAAELGVPPEHLFDQMLRDSPPGALGLTLQPFWNPGVRVPGPEAKGAIIGFGDVHTRAHLYRAIIEGIGYALKEGLERVQRRNHITVECLRVSGGGSQSEEIVALTANLFNLPAERPHTFETSGLGAAINAAVGVGIYPNHLDAVNAMTRVRDRFEPDAAIAERYQALYDKVYRQLYAKLAPLYRHIRHITGYPS